MTTSTPPLPLTRASIGHAHSIISPSAIHRTPLLSSASLSAATNDGNNILLFKNESVQRGGAFKIRGASYSMSCLTPDELKRGVCTHSSGNHAGALALAAQLRSVPCHLVMPEDAARPKVAAARAYGASITFCKPTAEARALTLAQVQKETGAIFIPPYDAVNTMLGQGTTFLEMEQQCREGGWGALGAVIAPVGGGGLLGGISTAAKGTGVRVFGAEPEGADDCARGIAAGERITSFTPSTIADGLRSPIGVLNFAVIQANVESIITVSEAEIIAAQRLIWERLKCVVEPTGAVAFAAARSNAFKALGVNGPVGIVISGGNVDLDKPLPWTV